MKAAYLRATALTFALVSLSSEAWACAPGAALPIREFIDPDQRCSRSGDVEAGQVSLSTKAAETQNRLRARLDADIGTYDRRAFGIKIANAVLDMAASSPWGKAALNIPFAEGVYEIGKRHVIDGIKESDQRTLQQSVKQIYAEFLASNPGELTPQKGRELSAFVRHLGNKLTWEAYGPAGKEVDAYLIAQVGELRGELERVRADVQQQLQRGTRGSGQPKLTLPDGQAVDAAAATSALRKEFNAALVEGARRTAKDLEIILAYQEAAARQQAALVADVTTIKATIQQQAAQIEANTAQIRTNTTDIVKIQRDLTRFSVLQEQTAMLASVNSARLDVVGSVLFDNVDARSKLKLVEGGAVRLGDAEKQKLVSVLKDRIEADEQIATINRFAAGVEVASKVLAIGRKAGLSQQDAERGAKLLAVAEIGIGVARIYAGDVSGILGVANGASTLFGGDPEPDPTQQLIQEQFRVVNLKLDRISDQVTAVSDQVSALADWSVGAHRDVMQQLSVLEGLGRSNQVKLEYLIELAHLSSPRECQVVGGSEAELYVAGIRQGLGFSGLSRLNEENAAAPELRKCVTQFMTVANKYQLPFVHYRESQTLLEDYPRLVSRPYSAGVLPKVNTITQCAGARLLDPLAVYLVGETLLATDPVLYLSNNIALRPVTAFSTSEHRARHRRLMTWLARWEEAVDCTLAQQSLVSGGVIYREPVLNSIQAVLTGPGVPPLDRARFAKEVMNGDLPYLHLNLATRILYSEFKETPEMFALLREAQDICASLDGDASPLVRQLNESIRRQRFGIESVPKLGSPGCSLAVKVGAKIGEESFDKLLNIAPAGVVAADKMIYPDELDALAELKVRLAKRHQEYELSLSLLDDPNAQAFLDSIYSNTGEAR